MIGVEVTFPVSSDTGKVNPANHWDIVRSNISYPLFGQAWPSPFPNDPNATNLNVDPQFENAPLGDLRLSSASTLYNIGDRNYTHAPDLGDVNSDLNVTPGFEIPFAPDIDFGGGSFFKAPQDGVLREQGSVSPGSAPLIDIGAYERE